MTFARYAILFILLAWTLSSCGEDPPQEGEREAGCWGTCDVSEFRSGQWVPCAKDVPLGVINSGEIYLVKCTEGEGG